MRTLTTPIEIGGTTSLRNRLYRAPVLEGAGDGDDAGDIYAKQFVANARAGVGLIIQGNACLMAEGRTSPGMTRVDTRERTLRLADMVRDVHDAGSAIWLQVGHGGLFSMEAWHEPFASDRAGSLLVASPLPWYLRPFFRRTPVHAMTTAEVHEMCARYGEVAAWAREAGYDGIQLASANAKLVHQFLSPFFNRRDDEFGGTVKGRAHVLEVIRERIVERAGADFTCAVKIPIAEKAPPTTPKISWDEGIELVQLAEGFGYDSVTPVHVSVIPDTTLSRGGIPSSLWENPAMRSRFEAAAPRAFERRVVQAGYRTGRFTPFEPVWNRSRFMAAKAKVLVPILAVGGIRTGEECNEILDEAQADLVGIGRPFYAEPSLAARIIDAPEQAARCQNSNLCVPAQMLGMKSGCYNPAVRVRRASETDGH